MKRTATIALYLMGIVLIFLSGYWLGHRPAAAAKAYTVIRVDTVYKDAPVIIKQIPVPVPINVDTAAILAAYYTQRIYDDTLINVPDIYVSLRDTVYQNRLLGRATVYKVNLPVYRHALSLGMTVGFRNISVMAGYRYKRTEYIGGYDLFNRAAFVGAKYNLFQWR